MIDSSHSLYKLIILYMMNKVTFPLTNSQISDLILSENYANYFHIQESLAEMIDSGLITSEKKNDTVYYTMTDKGRETIRYFENEISPEIRREISNYLVLHSYQMRSESSTTADYFRNSDGDYTVNCSVREGTHPLIELKFTVPSETSAKTLANNWKTKAQDCYAAVMKILM